MAGEDLLLFEKVKKEIVEAVADSTYQSSDGHSITFANSIKVRGIELILRQLTGSEELLFKAWYGKVLSGKLSGNFYVKCMARSNFRSKGNETYCVFAIRRYASGNNIGYVLSGRGYYVMGHKELADIYVGTVALDAKEVLSFKASVYEKEIVEATEIAARLAKSMAKHVIPVISIHSGEIVDYAAVGYEDLLFMEYLRYLLYRRREERMERFGGA